MNDLVPDTAAPVVIILSESAVEVTFGDTVDLKTHRKVMAFQDYLLAQPFPGLVSVVPAYASVTVVFDPLEVYEAMRPVQSDFRTFSPARAVLGLLDKILKANDLKEGTTDMKVQTPVEIPVRYDGPDLPEVAERLNLTAEEVIRLHSEPVYTVFMIGFQPGFPYLGPLPAALELPRRSTPRLRVPAGSVAIAGRQTGIYPQSSPGGWHLIGHTDFQLFDPAARPPARLQAGGRVRFVRCG